MADLSGNVLEYDMSLDCESLHIGFGHSEVPRCETRQEGGDDGRFLIFLLCGLLSSPNE